MINLGTVKPGSTIYIPFESFASSTGAPITISGLATSDIQVYKDGGTTQRGSASGFTLLDTDGIDFDGITGIHGFSIDLSDNTTADFWAAGSKYFVVVSTITVDSQTMSFIAATFRIGYDGAILDTTIATLSSQTSFTLTSGPAEDDALNGRQVVIHDAASAVQLATAIILDYTGSTKTVTLAAAPTFTIAAKDNFSVLGIAPLTGAQTATAVWTDTTAGDFTVANSIGKSIMNGVSLGTGLTVAVCSSVTALGAGAVASIWDALLSGITTASSIGKLIKDNINAAISSRMASYTQPTGFLTTDFTTLGSNASNAAGNAASAYLAALDAANFASTAATQATAANTRVQLGVPAFAPGTGGGVLIAGTNAAFTVAGDVTFSGDFDITGHLRPVGGFLGNQVGDFTGDFTGNLQTELTDLISTIGVSGAGLTDLGGMSSTMKSQVNTEADTALTDFRASALDETKVGNTVEAALVAARAQGFGKWAIVGTTLNLYASNGTTIVKSFTLDSDTTPTSRS